MYRIFVVPVTILGNICSAVHLRKNNALYICQRLYLSIVFVRFCLVATVYGNEQDIIIYYNSLIEFIFTEGLAPR